MLFRLLAKTKPTLVSFVYLMGIQLIGGYNYSGKCESAKLNSRYWYFSFLFRKKPQHIATYSYIKK